MPPETSASPPKLRKESTDGSFGDTFHQTDDVNTDNDMIRSPNTGYGLAMSSPTTTTTAAAQNVRARRTLEEEREYGVLRVDDNTICLGAAFDGTPIDAGNPFGVAIGQSAWTRTETSSCSRRCTISRQATP